MATALEYLKECPVCQEEFTDPRVFPCDHSLCLNCIGQIKKGYQIKCPECNAIHNVRNVRRDFRLMQFLDALKEERDNKAGTLPKQDEKPICDVCLSESAFHWCENCKQWFCNGCKKIHTRIASTKLHKLEPVAKKIEDIKINYEQEIQNMKSMFEDSSVFEKEIQDKISELEGNKIEVLEVSSKLRKQAMADIEEYFDSIDAKMLSYIQCELDKLKQKKNNIQAEFQERRANRQRLNQMIQENSRELLSEGETILKETKHAKQRQIPRRSATEKVEIELIKGASWNPATAATLSMDTVTTDIHAETTVTGRMVPPATSSPSQSTSCQSIHEFVSEKAPVDLSTIANKHFKRIGQVALKTDLCSGLRAFGNSLWSCQRDKIEIFDRDLNITKVLRKKEWYGVMDVVITSKATIIIASQNGLHHINDTGDIIKQIDSGTYTSVDIYKDILYASECKTYTICSYTFSDEGFVKQNSIKLPYGRSTMIGIDNEEITVCYPAIHIVEICNLSGQRLRRYDTRVPIGILYPILCQVDNGGTMLLSNKDNHELNLLDKHCRWNIVVMEPMLYSPVRAVYVDDILYVQGGILPNYKLCKYSKMIY